MSHHPLQSAEAPHKPTLRKNSRVLWAIITAAFISGCASHSTLFNKPVVPDEVPRLIAESPHVTPISNKHYPERTESSEIKLFNYTFHPLNQPDLVKDWKNLYMIGPASAPTWRYEKLEEILVYIRRRDDEAAFKRFRELASSHGGDAVIDMHRKPIITRSPPAPIDAFMYYGVVVRKSE